METGINIKEWPSLPYCAIEDALQRNAMLHKSSFIITDNIQCESCRVDRRNTEWPIPFSYTTSADPEGQTLVWLTERSGTFSVNASSVTWIKGKIEPHSLYRVNYDSSGWKDLQDMITRNHSELPAVQRKSLFSDAFALAR